MMGEGGKGRGLLFVEGLKTERKAKRIERCKVMRSDVLLVG